MNKNTVIGLICIGAILFGFSWYNNKQYTAQLKEKERLDSIARANAPKITEERAYGAEDAFEQGTLPPDSAALEQNNSTPKSYLGSFLDEAIKPRDEEFQTLENDVMKITFGSKGGRVASVELKGYTTYGGKPLMLFENETTDLNGLRSQGSRFNINLFAPEQINTADFYFKPQKISDNQISFRLYADSTSYLEYIYTLKPKEYMVDFKVDLSHFKNTIIPNQPDINVAWSVISPQQEKGFKNENTYTTIVYRYPDQSSIEDLGFSTDRKSERITTRVNWVAFKQQFFSSILVAPNNFASADLGYATYPETSNNIKDFSALMTLPYNPTVDGYDLNFYFGPNKYSVLKQYENTEFRRLVPLGWGIFGWVNRYLVIPIFDFLGKFIDNFGIVILLLTIIVKLLIFPLTYKSYLSTAKMRLLKPEMDKINERFPKKEDAMKKQQAVMGLYKSAGVSPMGGCWPMLIQMPILIALFRFFPASIELRGESFLWADDLAAYDSILDFGFNIPFYGDHISLFTLLMVVTLFVNSKINMSQQSSMSNQQMPGMKFMMLYMMPTMLLLWFNNYAAGLTYYYFLSNLITMGQTFAFRYAVDDKKLHAQMQENSKKPIKKSKWQQRLEEMQRQQQAMQQQQRKKK